MPPLDAGKMLKHLVKMREKNKCRRCRDCVSLNDRNYRVDRKL